MRGIGRKVMASNVRIVCELHPYLLPEFGDSYEALRRLGPSTSPSKLRAAPSTAQSCLSASRENLPIGFGLRR
jgi:hypothetical protein